MANKEHALAALVEHLDPVYQFGLPNLYFGDGAAGWVHIYFHELVVLIVRGLCADCAVLSRKLQAGFGASGVVYRGDRVLVVNLRWVQVVIASCIVCRFDEHFSGVCLEWLGDGGYFGVADQFGERILENQLHFNQHQRRQVFVLG